MLFVAGFAGLIGSLLLLRNSAQALQGQSRAVPGAWLAAAFLQAMVTSGPLLWGKVSPGIVFGLINLLQILAVSLVWLGSGLLKGDRRPAWVAFVPSAIWLAACLWPEVLAVQPLRLAILAPLVFGPLLWSVADLLNIWRRHRVRAALDMAILVGIVAVCLLAEILYTIAVPRMPDRPGAVLAGFPGLLLALYVTILPFLMLAVMREFDSIEERGRREAALQAGRREVERLHAGLPAIVFLSRITIARDVLHIERIYRGGDTLVVFGWGVADLAGVTDLQGISDYGDGSLVAHYRKTIEAGEHRWEWRIRRKDGGWSWIRTRARLLAILPCGGAEVVGYNLNIDRVREAEARAMSAARLASLGEMAGGLAHEIRQPLQSISLAAEVAQIKLREGDIAAASKRLDWIVDQTQRTSDLIESLRRFARGAEDEAERQPVCVVTAIEAALELMRGSLRDARIEVEIATPDPQIQVHGQSVLIEQVLSNLLLNARDALAGRPAEAPRRIRIEVASGPGTTVRLVLSDTGGGIAEAVLPRLFEPFVTTKGPDKGTGIGLSICHGLVKGMGGSIEAWNDADGAVFTITLPAAGVDAAAQVAPQSAVP